MQVIKQEDYLKVMVYVNNNGAKSTLTLEEVKAVGQNLITTDDATKCPWPALLPAAPYRRVEAAKKQFISLGYKEAIKIKRQAQRRKSPMVICDEDKLSAFSLDGFSLCNSEIARRQHYFHRKEKNGENLIK